MHAARALIALRHSAAIPASEEELAMWGAIADFAPGHETSTAASEDKTGPTKDGEEESDRDYYIPYEIAKKWANALAHAFGVSEQAFARRVGEIVTSDLGVPVRNWDDDPRAKRGIYRTYGRRTRVLTALREYQAESAISIFLGELRSEIHLDGADDEYLQLVLRTELLTLGDGRWLSDRRDPTPAPTRAWVWDGHHSNWQWNIDPGDFEALLFAFEERLCIAGSWTESDGYNIERIDIASALAKPELANDLLRACHFDSRKRYYDIPDDDWSRRPAGKNG